MKPNDNKSYYDNFTTDRAKFDRFAIDGIHHPSKRTPMAFNDPDDGRRFWRGLSIALPLGLIAWTVIIGTGVAVLFFVGASIRFFGGLGS